MPSNNNPEFVGFQTWHDWLFRKTDKNILFIIRRFGLTRLFMTNRSFGGTSKPIINILEPRTVLEVEDQDEDQNRNDDAR